MAAKVYGNKSHVAFAEETTWGTAVTPPTNFIELMEAESFTQTRERVFPPTGNTRSIYHEVAGMKTATGGFKTMLTYNGDELLLLKHVMGSVSTGSVNADGQYTHTLSFAEALPVGLTFYANRNSAVYGKEFQYPGYMLNKCTISQPIGQPASISFEGTGSGAMTEVTATSPTFPAIELATWNHLATSVGTFTLNGATVPCDNLTINIENTLSGVQVLTQNTLADQKADGERIVTMTFDTYIVASDPVYALFTGDTEFATVVKWRGALIAGTSYAEFGVTASQCKITEHPGPQGGAGGVIKGSVTIRCKASAALNNELSIVIKNENSAL